ncbi:VWA domain-containing protein [Erythrobacter sp. LQ02-29]|uniref:VWA domain-containing protein n=1 Tax=Erythrobacter sp. LQ02-29 TaxID=2920384 RepID=UPI001F4E6929|nr:VWA domain-containing protein [Erythrobacter sp. LQ02-29]
MTDRGPAGERAWRDAMMAARLMGAGLRAVVVRARPGFARDAFLERVTGTIGREILRLSPESDVAALAGEADVFASLAAGRAVRHRTLAERARGKLLLVTGCERLRPDLTALLAATLERADEDARTVLIDEGGEGDDAALPPSLAARAPVLLDLHRVALADISGGEPPSAPGEVSQSDLEALADACERLAIRDPRALLHAWNVARAAAALWGRAEAFGFVARTVLAPRATALPETEGEPPEPEPQEQTDDAGGSRETDNDDEMAPPDAGEIVVEAEAAALASGIASAHRGGLRGAGAGSSTAKRGMAAARGRLGRSRKGLPRDGRRLDLLGTLIAAAPRQARGGGERLQIRRDDIRYRERQPRQRSATVFAIDASGSAALARLAEVKGAVEQLLAESYVRRDEAALVAFRGAQAETVLPRTRSLARAQRLLAGLAGGGGTPLAAGMREGLREALAARVAGRAVLLVVVTDGGGNIDLEGRPDRARAQEDALAVAESVARSGIPALVVDCGARSRPVVRELAAAMKARYYALPRLDREALSGVASEAQARARAA